MACLTCSVLGGDGWKATQLRQLTGVPTQASHGSQTSVNYSWHLPKENRERWRGTREGVL